MYLLNTITLILLLFNFFIRTLFIYALLTIVVCLITHNNSLNQVISFALCVVNSISTLRNITIVFITINNIIINLVNNLNKILTYTMNRAILVVLHFCNTTRI